MGYGRAMLWGAATGLVVIALAVGGIVLAGPSLRSPMRAPGDKVLLVVASRDGTDTAQVAQLIGLADTSGGGLTVSLVDPQSTATVPGTSYDELRDAYSFGGPEGVAKAYAAARGQQALPVIGLSEAGLTTLVDRVGGITLTVPSGIDVFDGKRLFTFPAGPQKLDGRSTVALLSAVDFAGSAKERATLRAAVAGALAEAVGASSADLGDLVTKGYVTSSLKDGGLASVGEALRRGLPSVTIRPSDR